LWSDFFGQDVMDLGYQLRCHPMSSSRIMTCLDGCPVASIKSLQSKPVCLGPFAFCYVSICAHLITKMA